MAIYLEIKENFYAMSDYYENTFNIHYYKNTL